MENINRNAKHARQIQNLKPSTPPSQPLIPIPQHLTLPFAYYTLLLLEHFRAIPGPFTNGCEKTYTKNTAPSTNQVPPKPRPKTTKQY